MIMILYSIRIFSSASFIRKEAGKKPVVSQIQTSNYDATKNGEKGDPLCSAEHSTRSSGQTLGLYSLGILYN